MTIQNFTKFVDKTLVKKGSKLFDNKRVTALEEAQEGLWVANVDDKGTHEVEVLLHKNTIREFSCDCTQANGKICGHVVSVFLAIDAQKQAGKAPTKPKKLSFDKLLESISHAELMSFIKSYSQTNKIFKADFELHFSDKNTSVDFEKMFTEVIDKTLRPRTREGYLSNATELAKEIKKHIKTAETYIGKNNFRDSFTIAKLLLEKTKEIDSKGGLNTTLFNYGVKISELIHLIVIYDKVPLDFKEEIFSYLMEIMSNYNFHNMSYATSLFEDAENLSIKLKKTDAYLNLLNDQLAVNKYATSTRRYYSLKKYNFLKKIGDNELLEKHIDNSLSIKEFRELRVREFIKKKNYTQAKILLEEGIAEVKKKNKYYYDNDDDFIRWESYLFIIADIEKDIEYVRSYTKKYALKGAGSNTFYQKWKDTYSEKEWERVICKEINSLTKEFEKSSGFSTDYNVRKFYAPPALTSLCFIYINEKQLDKLWELIKNTSTAFITLYLSYIKDYIPNEVVNTLCSHISKSLKIASERDEYAFLGKVLNLMLDTFSQPKLQEKIKHYIIEIRETYKRKKALIDELNNFLE